MTANILLTATITSLLLFSCGGEVQNDENKTSDTETEVKAEDTSTVVTEDPAELVEENIYPDWVSWPAPEGKYIALRADEVEELYENNKGYAEDDDYMEFEVMHKKVFNRLTPFQNLVYCLNHFEGFDQVCAISMRPENKNEYVMGYLAFDEESLTLRQIHALESDRDSVMYWLHHHLISAEKVHHNVNRTIQELSAIELIPAIMERYKKDGNTDYLTVLCQLMREYPPFKVSNIYKYLFEEHTPYTKWQEKELTQEEMWMDYATAIPLNKENEHMILYLAENRYKHYFEEMADGTESASVE